MNEKTLALYGPWLPIWDAITSKPHLEAPMNYRASRKQLGIGLAPLAKVLKVQPEALRQYETGQAAWPEGLELRYLQIVIIFVCP